MSVYNITNLVSRFKEKKTKNYLQKKMVEVNEINKPRTREDPLAARPVKYLVNNNKTKNSLQKPLMLPIYNFELVKHKRQKFDYSQPINPQLILFPDKSNYHEFFQTNTLQFEAPLLEENASGHFKLQRDLMGE